MRDARSLVAAIAGVGCSPLRYRRRRAAVAAALRRRAVGAAPAGQPIELVFPLVADTTGLRAASPPSVSTPGSPQLRPVRVDRRPGAPLRSAGRTPRSGSWPTCTGSARARSRSIAPGCSPTRRYERGAGRSALFATPLAQFRTARGARFVAPTPAAPVPRGLRGAVTGVIGLDTRARSARHRSSSRARARPAAHDRLAADLGPAAHRHRRAPAPAPPARSAGEVGGDPATAGFTPNQYLTAYGYDPLYSAGLRGPGRAGRADRDRRLQRTRTSRRSPSASSLDIPPLNGFGVGLRHPLPPGGEVDARPRGAGRGGTRSQGDRRLRDRSRRGRHAAMR